MRSSQDNINFDYHYVGVSGGGDLEAKHVKKSRKKLENGIAI
jgi:hypothetical protein